MICGSSINVLELADWMILMIVGVIVAAIGFIFNRLTADPLRTIFYALIFVGIVIFIIGLLLYLLVLA